MIANELAQAMQKTDEHSTVLQIEHMRMQLRLPKSMKLKKFIRTYRIFLRMMMWILSIFPHRTIHIYNDLREALKHGKHVLCEKSITLNAKELEEAKQLAEENGVVLAEAMTIYHMPLYKKLQEVIRSGKLGKLCMAQMNLEVIRNTICRTVSLIRISRRES